MKALLIAGDGRFFLDETLKFRRYLKKEVGITDIQVVKTGYMTVKHIWTCLRKALDPSKVSGPLLLLYCGHGAEDGWGVSFCRTISYQALVGDLLKNYPEPILFVNDCCYAAAPIGWFKKFGVSREKMSFIAATNSKERVESVLVGRVLKSWKRQKPHQPSRHRVCVVDIDKPASEEERKTPEIRWGVELDNLFYSKFPWDPKRDRLRIGRPIVVTVDPNMIIKEISEEIPSEDTVIL